MNCNTRKQHHSIAWEKKITKILYQVLKHGPIFQTVTHVSEALEDQAVYICFCCCSLFIQESGQMVFHLGKFQCCSKLGV